MRYLVAIAAVALVAPLLMTPSAQANWVGDIIYCANARYQTTTVDTYRFGTAVAYSDFNTGYVGGGAANTGDVAYGLSEPMGQTDSNWGSRDVVWDSRAIVMYDADSALQLNALRWTTGGQNVWLTQLEYRANQAYENDPGVIDFVTSTTGGVLSGRLQLAVGPEGGYNYGLGYLGTRKRLPNVEAQNMRRSDNVWDMSADRDGNLYVAGRDISVGKAMIFKVPKLNGGRWLGELAGQRAGDANVFGAEQLLVTKATGFSGYSGVAVDNAGYIYATDRWGMTIDVYNAAGAPVMSIDAANELALVPEAIRVDPTYAGPGTRVVLNVLDPAALDKILVLDINPVATTWAVKARLQSGDLRENGDANLNRVDWIEISAAGDIFYVDSRDTNDARHAMIAAADYQAAVAAGGVQTVTVVGADVFNDRTNTFGRGAAFVPEPASLALLAMGGLALIRRRK